MDKWVRDKLKEWEEQGITPEDVLERWEAQRAEARAGSRDRYNQTDKATKAREAYYTPGGGHSQLKARKKVQTVRDKQKAIRAEADRRKKQRNPARTKAQSAISNALKAGLITKPDACVLPEPLDETHEGRVEADHHLGYSEENQLDVLWVCHRCHVALEKQRRGVNYGRHIGSG